MLFEEARARLNEWCRLLGGKDASTNKIVQTHSNPEGLTESWWLQNEGTAPDWRGSRTVAYFAAYIEIYGGEFPMDGIPVDDGYLWPDRAVMRSLLRADCVRCNGGIFEVTNAGEALLAPMLTFSDDYVTVSRHLMG